MTLKFRYPLFKVETNKNFYLKNIKKNKFFDKVLNNFGINTKYSIYIINKKSKTSKIYFIKNKNKIFVLRASNVKQSKFLKGQCELISSIKKNFYFKILSGKTGYIYKLGNLNFFLYQKVKGKIFDGKTTYLNYIFNNILLLHKIFKKRNISRSKLQIKKYNLKKIKKNINLLINKRFINQTFLKNILGKKTKIILFDNSVYVKNCIKKISKLNIKKKNFQVVHGDLNHSNIIVYNRRITFLDLEDLVIDDLKIALSTSIFKILRHVIYKNNNQLNYINKYSFNLCNNFVRKKYFKDRYEVINFCIFRILSDISFIIDSIKLGEKKYLYDFEKKILNLIELRYKFRLYGLKARK